MAGFFNGLILLGLGLIVVWFIMRSPKDEKPANSIRHLGQPRPQTDNQLQNPPPQPAPQTRQSYPNLPAPGPQGLQSITESEARRQPPFPNGSNKPPAESFRVQPVGECPTRVGLGVQSASQPPDSAATAQRPRSRLPPPQMSSQALDGTCTQLADLETPVQRLVVQPADEQPHAMGLGVQSPSQPPQQTTTRPRLPPPSQAFPSQRRSQAVGDSPVQAHNRLFPQPSLSQLLDRPSAELPYRASFPLPQPPQPTPQSSSLSSYDPARPPAQIPCQRPTFQQSEQRPSQPLIVASPNQTSPPSEPPSNPPQRSQRHQPKQSQVQQPPTQQLPAPPSQPPVQLQNPQSPAQTPSPPHTIIQHHDIPKPSQPAPPTHQPTVQVSIESPTISPPWSHPLSPHPPTPSEQTQVVTRQRPTRQSTVPPSVQPKSSSQAQKSDTHVIFADLLLAIIKYERAICNRGEFTAVRTQFYSEVMMFIRQLHPPTLQAVEEIRARMNQFTQMNTLEELQDDADVLLKRCTTCKAQLVRLIPQYGYVMGNLHKLGNKMEYEREEMEESIKIFLEARISLGNAKVSNGWRIFRKQGTKMTNGCAGTENLADRQEREIDGLRECTLAFEALYACQMLFEKILESLVRQLDSINVDLNSVIHAGTDAATPGIHYDTANRAFARLKEKAPAVEWACDLVLESRWEFPRVMGQIGADRLLTELYEKEWLEQYNRNFPKQ